MSDDVKRWCGRSAAGTESAGMNPMVEWFGDDDQDTPYVLASDYDILLAKVARLERIEQKAREIVAERALYTSGDSDRLCAQRILAAAAAEPT